MLTERGNGHVAGYELDMSKLSKYKNLNIYELFYQWTETLKAKSENTSAGHKEDFQKLSKKNDQKHRNEYYDGMKYHTAMKAGQYAYN